MKWLIPILAILVSGCQMSVSDAKPTSIHTLSDGEHVALNPKRVQKAIEDTSHSMYGFNGEIPGPRIEMQQGDTITANVQNSIDHETTVHWHGIRIDNQYDGVPDLTQDVIQPGQSFSYNIHGKDEGIYWYHPHVREDVQQDLGLYGNLLVRSKDPNAYNLVNQEEFLIFDDIMTDYDGTMISHGEDAPNYALMGRFGDVLLVNGDTEYALTVEKGSVIRFYLTNVANTRTFRIQIPGVRMKRVGSDVGRYEEEEWVDAITIAPAERYIVEALFDEVGTFDLMHQSPVSSHIFGSITVEEKELAHDYSEEFQELRSYDDVSKDIDAFRPYFDKPVDHTLLLDIEMKGEMAAMDHSGMTHHTPDGIEWEDSMPGMNEIMNNEDLQWKLIDADTGNVNMDIHWQFKVGDIKKIQITNLEDSPHPMQHPIHFHGQRFLVLSTDGKPNTNLVWKDTVLVPTGSSVELLFDMANPGKWMFHCHIAEHLSNGMMGMFTVTQ